MMAQKRQQTGGTKKMELPAHHSTVTMTRQEYAVEREQVVIVDQYSTKIIEGNVTISQASGARAALISRGISIQMMERIFNKNVKKYVSQWRKGVVYQNGGL